MKGPVKVLFVHPTGSLHNPVLTVFAHVARHIDRERFQAYVALDRSADGTLDLADDDAVITRWDLATRPAEPAQHSRAGIAMRLGPSIAALARYARRQGIDIVHVDGTPSCGGI